jgi:hypothetical protein
VVLLTLLKEKVLVFGIASFGVTLFIGVTLAMAEGTPGVGISREFVAALTRGAVAKIVVMIVVVVVIGIAIAIFVVFILIIVGGVDVRMKIARGRRID